MVLNKNSPPWQSYFSYFMRPSPTIELPRGTSGVVGTYVYTFSTVENV